MIYRPYRYADTGGSLGSGHVSGGTARGKAMAGSSVAAATQGVSWASAAPELKINLPPPPERYEFELIREFRRSKKRLVTSRHAGLGDAARKASAYLLRVVTDGAVTSGPIAPLDGLPLAVDVPGQGSVAFGPLQSAHQLAGAYMESAGLPYHPVKTYKKVDPARAARIAAAYDAMPHAMNDPSVRRAYDALIGETLAQYQYVKKAGITIEIIAGDKDPYRASPRLAIIDVTRHNHLWVYPTSTGFGDGDDASEDNILLKPTTETIGGIKLCANDVFRIVHDYFGHIKDGIGFRADGEENAWRSHAAMYSRLALGAITSELRGQNSWLNFGPCSEHNRTASAADTTYAPQKNGLLPEWVWDEGRKD